MIENLVKQNVILMKLGITKTDSFNNNFNLNLLLNIAEFERGTEVDSSKYIEIESPELIHYLRVGDLQSLGNTFI